MKTMPDAESDEREWFTAEEIERRSLVLTVDQYPLPSLTTEDRYIETTHIDGRTIHLIEEEFHQALGFFRRLVKLGLKYSPETLLDEN